MQLPYEPSPGTPIDADWGRTVVQNLRSLAPRGGPGVRVAQNGNGTSFSAPGPGINAGPIRARQLAPKMFQVGCYQSKIYVRIGIVQMGTLHCAVGIHEDDSGSTVLTGRNIIIDVAAGWTDDESRFPFIEIHPGAEPVAYVRLSADSNIPNDDPNGIVFRWPLAEVTGRMVAVAPTIAVPEPDPSEIFMTSVVDVLHDGIIKMPGELANP